MNKKQVGFLSLIIACYAFQPSINPLFKYPSYFPAPAYNFENNSPDKEKVELGKLLFFDPILSKDNSISCASCHSPYNAFAHTDHDLSHGINDSIGLRNAPALFNLAWQRAFMWDGAINHLDMQALAPISSPSEMGEKIERVVSKLEKESFYTDKFNHIYQDSLITGERILKLLSQFQLTLISSDSKYDKVKKGEIEFTSQEKNGYRLFKTNCNSCHNEPLFSNYQFENNALPIDTLLNDSGRVKVSLTHEDYLKFKVPSLRNLSYSFPYMHDGRFSRLNQVLKHYTSSEVQKEFETNLNQKAIHLNMVEKTDLIAFLLTLDDKEFIFNPKHQFPRELLYKTKDIEE